MKQKEVWDKDRPKGLGKPKQLSKLQKERVEAISEADVERVQELDGEIESLRSAPPPGDNALREWAEQNSWYTNDSDAREVAEGIAINLANSGFRGSQRDLLDEVARRVKKVMPHKFENPRRQESLTAGNSTIEQEPEDNSYAALPPEAKAACDRIVNEKLMTKEEYVAEYFGN